MATYKKQLKDQNGDNIIPALGTATVTGTNIDWSTMGESAACTYATNYAARSSDPALMVFKLGKIVVLTGVAQNTVQRSFGDYWYEEKVATVPEGFRPAENYSGGLHRGSGAFIYRTYVKTNGDLGYTQANQGTGTSGASFGAGSFFPFMMVWVTD